MGTPAAFLFSLGGTLIGPNPARSSINRCDFIASRCQFRGIRGGSDRTFLSVRASSDPPQQVHNVSVLLLAGGVGSRMKSEQPKQFLRLRDRTVVEHSLRLFLSMPEVGEVVLVVAPEYKERFSAYERARDRPRLLYASPGEDRQDSVYNGLCQVGQDASLICVHDAARPLVTPQCVRNVFGDAMRHGAAVLGVPSKATIKESADGEFVLRTIPRDRLWEIQTPQVIRPHLLRSGFEKVMKENLAVTDDVSIVELLGLPVKITKGEYTNIKLTTPEDMNIAESILRDRSRAEATA